MKCRICGHLLGQSERFCGKCGTEVSPPRTAAARKEYEEPYRMSGSAQETVGDTAQSCEQSPAQTVYDSGVQQTEAEEFRPPAKQEINIVYQGSPARKSPLPVILGAAAAVLAVAAIALWVINPRPDASASQLSADSGAAAVQETAPAEPEEEDNSVQVADVGNEDTKDTPKQQVTADPPQDEPAQSAQASASQPTQSTDTTVEAVVAAIKDNYYGIQYNLDDYTVNKVSKVRTWYTDSNGVLRKVVLKASSAEGRSRSEEFYYDENGRLNFGFAYDSDKNEYRYYYREGLIYRYIDNHKNVSDYPGGKVPTGEAAEMVQDGEAERSSFYG